MGKALIVIGLGIAYLCWITKRGGEYWDKKSPGVMKRRAEIKRKLEGNEKLTKIEFFDFYVSKIIYGSLKLGVYGGFIISITGVILLIIK